MSETLVPVGPELLGLGNYDSFGMAIESVAGNTKGFTVTTTGATYVLYRHGMELYRRIDPATNAIDISNEGKGRLVASLEFSTYVRDLTLDLSNSNRAIIESTTATFDFQSDSFFFVTAKESFSLTHNSLIIDAPYVAPLDPEMWDLDRLWTDGYGGAILASLSEDTKGVVISEAVNSTTVNLSVGDQTAHMAFPAKTYDFEGLYGEDARPFVHFVSNEDYVNFLMGRDAMDQYENSEFGVFVLWNFHYGNGFLPELLEPDGNVLGYNLDNPGLIQDFVATAHDNGFKVISYLYTPSNQGWDFPDEHALAGLHQDISVTLQFMRDFQQEYDLDGWYFDGADVGALIDDYHFIRQVRTDVGADGIIYHHNSVDVWEMEETQDEQVSTDRERRAIMIDVYSNYTLAGETGEAAEINDPNDPFIRYFATGYGLPQAYSTIKLKSDGRTAMSEAEKDRLIGQNLNGCERYLDSIWLNNFKPAYDVRATEYQDLTIEFAPDIRWPLDGGDWFRDAADVNVTNITRNSVTITWTTDADADSTVSLTDSEAWWPVEVLAANVADSDMVTSHQLTISSLNPETIYQFRIRSTNGNTAIPGQIIWGAVGTFTTDSGLPGDVDNDGFVGAEDLVTILSYWGQSGRGWEQGDLTGEGFVGAEDYVVVLSNWGSSAPAEPVSNAISTSAGSEDLMSSTMTLAESAELVGTEEMATMSGSNDPDRRDLANRPSGRGSNSQQAAKGIRVDLVDTLELSVFKAVKPTPENQLLARTPTTVKSSEISGSATAGGSVSSRRLFRSNKLGDDDLLRDLAPLWLLGVE